MRTDPLRARLIELGFVPIGSKPEELRSARIEAEITQMVAHHRGREYQAGLS